MTESDNGGAARGRFDASEDERAALAREAWELKDQGKSLRTIAAKFNDRGIAISHATVAQLINEAQENAKFLDYVGPAHARTVAIGQLDTALEDALDVVRSHKAALETGEMEGRSLDYVQAAAVLDKAQARYERLLSLYIKVTGAAMPTRHQIEDGDGRPVRHDFEGIAALERAVREHEQRAREIEDGLA